MVGGGGRSFVLWSFVVGSLSGPGKEEGEEKEEPGRKETRREKKRREEDVLFFLVTISPSSSLAVNAPPRPSLLVATSHVETMISRWRMEDVQRRKKGKEGKRTSFIASLRERQCCSSRKRCHSTEYGAE